MSFSKATGYITGQFYTSFSTEQAALQLWGPELVQLGPSKSLVAPQLGELSATAQGL